MDSSLIKLKSQDGKIFEVNEKCLHMSKFLKDLIDNELLDPTQEIEVKVDDGKTLSKIKITLNIMKLKNQVKSLDLYLMVI